MTRLRTAQVERTATGGRLVTSHHSFQAVRSSSRSDAISALRDLGLDRLPADGSAIWFLPPMFCECFHIWDTDIARAVAVSTIGIDLAARHLDAIADDGRHAVADAHAAALLVARSIATALVTCGGDKRLADTIDRMLGVASSQEQEMLCARKATFAMGMRKNRHTLIGAAVAAAATDSWRRFRIVERHFGRLAGVVQLMDDLCDIEDDMAASRTTAPIALLASGLSASAVISSTIQTALRELCSLSAGLSLLGAPVTAEYISDAAAELSEGFRVAKEVLVVGDVPFVARRIVPSVLQYGP